MTCVIPQAVRCPLNDRMIDLFAPRRSLAIKHLTLTWVLARLFPWESSTTAHIRQLAVGGYKSRMGGIRCGIMIQLSTYIWYYGYPSGWMVSLNRNSETN